MTCITACNLLLHHLEITRYLANTTIFEYYKVDVKLLSADINECQAGSHNCSAPAKCVNFEGGFRCSCNAGYKLSHITFAKCEGTSLNCIFCLRST